MFEDMIYYPAGDTIVALDARTGAVRWETVAAPGRPAQLRLDDGRRQDHFRTHLWAALLGRLVVTLRRMMPEPARNFGSSILQRGRMIP